MAEYYYLISQLPSLDGIGENTQIPITQERFLELCTQFLGKRAKNVIEKITLTPSMNGEQSGSALIDAWNESERDLRLALAKARAEKMHKTFDDANRLLPAQYVKTASTAIEMDDPMGAEEYLNRFRLGILEELRPTDNFSEEYIFYFGLKLRLIERIRRFDTETGETVYRNIYNSILNGDRLEEM